MVSGGACAAKNIQLCTGSLTIMITLRLNMTISARLIWWQLERYSLNRCHRQCRSYSILGLIAKTHPLGSLESQVYIGTPKLMICLNKNKVFVIHWFWAAQGPCQRATVWRPARLDSPVLVLPYSPKPWPRLSRTLTGLCWGLDQKRLRLNLRKQDAYLGFCIFIYTPNLCCTLGSVKAYLMFIEKPELWPLVSIITSLRNWLPLDWLTGSQMDASVTHLRGWSGELKVIENSLFRTLKEFDDSGR